MANPESSRFLGIEKETWRKAYRGINYVEAGVGAAMLAIGNAVQGAVVLGLGLTGLILEGTIFKDKNTNRKMA